MSRIHILFSKEKRVKEELIATELTEFWQPIDETYNDMISTNTYSMIYNLDNNSTVDKFKQAWTDSIDRSRTGDLDMRYNEYSKPTDEQRSFLHEKMNNIIDNINEFHSVYPIDSNLKLTDNWESNVPKLNSLHQYFEDTTRLAVNDNYYPREFYDNLEFINSAVHKLEKNPKHRSFHFTAIRNSNFKRTVIPMEDTDYLRYINTETPNRLFLDWGVVGKTLDTCFFTDDAELVRNNKSQQQSEIRPFINFKFTHNPLTKEDLEQSIAKISARIRAWLSSNNIDSIDLTLPKYRLGAVPIGTLENELAYDTYSSMRDEYPYLIGCYLEN